MIVAVLIVLYLFFLIAGICAVVAASRAQLREEAHAYMREVSNVYSLADRRWWDVASSAPAGFARSAGADVGTSRTVRGPTHPVRTGRSA